MDSTLSLSRMVPYLQDLGKDYVQQNSSAYQRLWVKLGICQQVLHICQNQHSTVSRNLGQVKGTLQPEKNSSLNHSCITLSLASSVGSRTSPAEYPRRAAFNKQRLQNCAANPHFLSDFFLLLLMKQNLHDMALSTSIILMSGLSKLLMLFCS